jgi:c-di-GMP-binding flagellar brake protein YcgR
MLKYQRLSPAFRFWAYELGRAHERKYPRLNVTTTVEYTVGEELFRSAVLTLSGGGLFIKDTQGLATGKELSLRFRPAKQRLIIAAKGVVRYVVEGTGTAIEFTEISDDGRNALVRLIHQKTTDRRLLPRAPLATQVECDQCMSLAFSRDLSLAGMFIETETPLPVGSSLKVRFNLNQKDRVITASAKVAYHLEKMGMGILFSEMVPSDRDAIREYVESTCSPPQEASATNL